MDITLTEFKTCHTLYDALYLRLRKIAESPTHIKQLLGDIQYISEKNSDILNTFIVGKSLLMNEADQTKIMTDIETSKDEIGEICDKSPRLSKSNLGAGIGKIKDQFSFALPLMLLSGQLHKLKKEKEAQTIFLFVYYRPYASKVASFFTLGTSDEDAMRYTVQIELNDKSYIHKYGTVIKTLEASAMSAYSTFIDTLAGSPIPSDDTLFNNIFYSSIFSKTGSWLKSLYGAYKKVKTEGKYIRYEQTFYGTTDKDTTGTNYNTVEVQSNSYIQRQYVVNAVTRFNIDPVNVKYVQQAVQYGFGSISQIYIDFLTETIQQIAATKSSKIPEYFDAIVGSFLNNVDSNGNRNRADEINTLKFLAYGIKNFRVSNTIDKNVKTMQNMTKNDIDVLTEDMLLTCSDKYISYGDTQRRHMRYSLIMYFILFIQSK